MVNVILDSSIIISHPKLLGLKIDNVRFIVPIDVIGELNERAIAKGKSFDDRVNLIDKGAIEGTISIFNTDLPGFQKYLTTVHYSKLSITDLKILATALFYKESGENVMIASKDKYIKERADFFNIEVISDLLTNDFVGHFQVPKKEKILSEVFSFIFEVVKQTIINLIPFHGLFSNIIEETASSIQGRIVLFERKENINLIVGILIGVLITLVTIGIHNNLEVIMSSINIWGTIGMTLLFGILLFILREKQRLSYGIFEFLVGVLTIIMLFNINDFDYTKINFSMDFNLKIAAGLYIMVRGQDNIVKAIKDSKLGLRLKKMGIGN